MSTLYRQRSEFEKQLLSALTPRLKKMSWKKNSCALYTATGDFYQDVFISVHRNSSQTIAELRFKPLNLDPILWDILDIPENRDRPLSFRTWGAFTCPGLPIYDANVEDAGDDPESVAENLLQLCADKGSLFQELLATDSFTNLVSAHPNQSERGAYAVTLVTSLISRGDLERAYETASSYACGARISCANLISSGKSFHQLAIDWLEAGRASRLALAGAAGA